MPLAVASLVLLSGSGEVEVSLGPPCLFSHTYGQVLPVSSLPLKVLGKCDQWSEGRSQSLSLGPLLLRLLPPFRVCSADAIVSPDPSRKCRAQIMFTAFTVPFAAEGSGHGFAFPTGQPQPPLPLGHGGFLGPGTGRGQQEGGAKAA